MLGLARVVQWPEVQNKCDVTHIISIRLSIQHLLKAGFGNFAQTVLVSLVYSFRLHCAYIPDKYWLQNRGLRTQQLLDPFKDFGTDIGNNIDNSNKEKKENLCAPGPSLQPYHPQLACQVLSTLMTLSSADLGAQAGSEGNHEQ